MENLENLEEVNKAKVEENYLPKGGFEIRNISLPHEKKIEVDSLITNTGIAPGEDPNIKVGTEADAASG